MKYIVNPSCRNSHPLDSIDELEIEISKEWTHKFEGIFAKIFVSGDRKEIIYLNKEIVDGKHLSLEDILVD